MKLTIVDSVSRHSGLGGAGFSEIDLPDVRVTRLLRLPTDSEKSTAAAQVVSLHRSADPTGLSPRAPRTGCTACSPRARRAPTRSRRARWPCRVRRWTACCTRWRPSSGTGSPPPPTPPPASARA
ncbi:hypothetical protein ACR6C2_14925 [Streptomyces sp. INA 01156]